MKKTIELCTFPDHDQNYCKVFKVPMKWLRKKLIKERRSGEKRSNIIKRFVDSYCWDETYFLYLQSINEKVMLEESEVS